MLINFIYALFFLVLFILVLCLITTPETRKMAELGQTLRSKGASIPVYPLSWPAPPANKGSYSSVGERYLIECAEHLFNRKFDKCRPCFMKNTDTGRNLELDGYCSDIGIALEYNGIQHYVWPNFTNSSFDEFEKQVERDSMKRRMCEDNGICLIVVPYTVSLERMPDYFYSKLIEACTSKIVNNNL